jgi:mannose-6-phosphate isomerase-like protein (cupin superfamily)
MATAGQTIRNPVTGETLTFLVTSADSNGQLLRVDVTAAANATGPPMHVHSAFVERYDIREGRVHVRLRGEVHVLEPSARLEIPRGAPHTFWIEGDRPARMVVDFEPAGTYETFLETLYGLAEDGKTNAKGEPNLLQMAVIGREHLDDFALAKPPIWMQRLLFAVLAPIGRLLGFRARYSARTAG